MMGDEGQADEEPGCWGSSIKNDGGKSCDPDFLRGRRHMKNKFCWYCTDGDLYVESTRVLGLPEELYDTVINSSTGGVWSRCEETFGTEDRFRVINNTAGCRSPRLIIWERSIPSLPDGLQWVPIPLEWSIDGYMHLSISRGTLVPTKRKHQRQQARRDEAMRGGAMGSQPNAPYGAQPSHAIYHPGGPIQLPGAVQFVCVMPGHMPPHGAGMAAFIPAQYGVPPSAPGHPQSHPPPLHVAHPSATGASLYPGNPTPTYSAPPPSFTPAPAASAGAASAALMPQSDMGMGALAEAAARLAAGGVEPLPPQPPLPSLEAVVSSAVGSRHPEPFPQPAAAVLAPLASHTEPEMAAAPGMLTTFKRPLPMEEMLKATKRDKKSETERMLMQKFEKLQARLSQRAERAADGSSDSSNTEEELPNRTSIQLSIVEQLCSLIENADAAKLKRVNAALGEIVSNDVSTATEYGETEVDEAYVAFVSNL